MLSYPINLNRCSVADIVARTIIFSGNLVTTFKKLIYHGYFYLPRGCVVWVHSKLVMLIDHTYYHLAIYIVFP